MKEGGWPCLCLQTMSGSESRTGDKVKFTSSTHNLYQSSRLPTLCILGAHIYFCIPPQEGWGFFPTQIWRGQNGTTSVGTNRSWLLSVSDSRSGIPDLNFRFRSGIGCKVYHHEVPIYPSLNLFLKEETPHLTLTTLDVSQSL